MKLKLRTENAILYSVKDVNGKSYIRLNRVKNIIFTVKETQESPDILIQMQSTPGADGIVLQSAPMLGVITIFTNKIMRPITHGVKYCEIAFTLDTPDPTLPNPIVESITIER